jgi:hypothetical protein
MEATCPYPEQHRSNICLESTSQRSILILSFHLHSGRPRVSFPQISHQNPICTTFLLIRTTFPAHLSLLDLISRMIVGEEYKAQSSSVSNLLNSPLTSYLIGPNNLLSALFSETFNLHFSLYTDSKTRSNKRLSAKQHPVTYSLE